MTDDARAVRTGFPVLVVTRCAVSRVGLPRALATPSLAGEAYTKIMILTAYEGYFLH